MRFMLMHRLEEDGSEWNPTPEFLAKMEAFIKDEIDNGVLLAGEGVFPTGAVIRKARGGGLTTTDGPYTEAKELIGGFAILNVADLAEAVEHGRRFAEMFDKVTVEVRQVVEAEDLPS